MNKQLAKKGTTLNKNMTNTEKLNLTDITLTDITNLTYLTVTGTISADEITAHFINTESISTPELAAECSELTLPTAAPTGNIPVVTVYYTHD